MLSPIRKIIDGEIISMEIGTTPDDADEPSQHVEDQNSELEDLPNVLEQDDFEKK